MATIDIGKIKPVFKGTYDNSTAYVLDDIVYYNGSSYVAKTSTTGNLPTDATKWNLLASGSGGIWDSTLGIGSAGQVVKVNSGATALEFGTPESGILKKVYSYYNNTPSSNSEDGSLKSVITSNTITPQSTSSVFYVESSIKGCTGNDGNGTFIQFSVNDGSSWTDGIRGTWSNTTKEHGGNFIMNDQDNHQVSHCVDYYAPNIATANFKVRCGTVANSGTTYINRNASGNTGAGNSSAVSTLKIFEFSSTTDHPTPIAKTS